MRRPPRPLPQRPVIGGRPVLIEEIDNSIDESYGAAPERLYLIGADGRVAYKGGTGPYFFDLDEWERAIESCLKKTGHDHTSR